MVGSRVSCRDCFGVDGKTSAKHHDVGMGEAVADITPSISPWLLSCRLQLILLVGGPDMQVVRVTTTTGKMIA